ncbi:MAG: hypothetical protein A3J28_07345 [Acidobacteria bacterium RIFCSPLOWO2_12_FULL_60_22]|nr:MAG: hypothetical protein A3J28_07345 [Acidobacteria bacterium RIFCSPLOWO2_12_FULL_60_22]
MKKHARKGADELLPEYDFAKMPGGVRGKYVQRYQQGTNLALLDRDVAEAFPNDRAVNDALRAVLKAAENLPSRQPHKQSKQVAESPGRSAR